MDHSLLVLRVRWTKSGPEITLGTSDLASLAASGNGGEMTDE